MNALAQLSRVVRCAPLALVVLAAGGCPSKPAEGGEADEPKKAEAADTAEAGAGAEAGAEVEPEAVASEEIPKWQGDDRDPAWYHPSIIPGAKELTNTGADVTGEGSLSRSIRLELPADATVDGCIDQLRQKVAASIGTEVPAATEKAGQKQVVGTEPNGAYKYTLMCGQVDDKVIAFVGYYLD